MNERAVPDTRREGRTVGLLWSRTRSVTVSNNLVKIKRAHECLMSGLPAVDVHTARAAHGCVGKTHSIATQRGSIIEASASAKRQRPREVFRHHALAIVRYHNLHRVPIAQALEDVHVNRLRSSLNRVVDELRHSRSCRAVARVSRCKQEVPCRHD